MFISNLIDNSWIHPHIHLKIAPVPSWIARGTAKCCTFLVGQKTSRKGQSQENASCLQWTGVPFSGLQLDTEILSKRRHAIRRKCPGLWGSHDNARSYTAWRVHEKIKGFRWELLEHLPIIICSIHINCTWMVATDEDN